MDSAGGHAARPSRPPPSPPLQLAACYKLVDKCVHAAQLSRHALHAELSARAAVDAEALFGDDSLVVADLRSSESAALGTLAVTSAASAADGQALCRRSWAVLLSLIPLLLRRVQANTLLPGTMKEEELDFKAHVLSSIFKVRNQSPPLHLVRNMASTSGYVLFLDALFQSLNLLSHPFWPAVQRKIVESFVLQGLDVIPRTAGIPANLITHEDDIVSYIERNLSPRYHGEAFCAAVLGKWRSNAVSSVLRARGVL